MADNSEQAVKWGGRPVKLRQDDRLLTGRGRFVGDVTPPGCLYLAFLRSPLAHAEINSLDLDDARDFPGVVAVISGADVAGLGSLPVNPLIEDMRIPPTSILAHNRVTAIGQPIAAVIADTQAAATDAAELIFADLEELESDGVETALIAKNWRSNDCDAAFEAAFSTVQVEVEHPRLAPSPMEPRCMVAEWREDRDTLTLWTTSQAPHRARRNIAEIIGLDEEQIRVVAPDVGGAFGMKASVYPEEVLTAFAARKLKCCVKWVASRAEDLLSASHGRGAKSQGELALSQEGGFLAVRAQIRCPLGNWLPFSAAVPVWNAGRILPGPYDIAAVDIDVAAHGSHTAPVGIYRGAGRPEAALLMERLVDAAARKLDLDPLEIRRRNVVGKDRFPHRHTTGSVLDSGDLEATLEAAAELSGYTELKASRRRRRDAGELFGIGISAYVEPSGQGWESARVRVEADGAITAASGSSSQGQARQTAYAQIVADVFEIDPGRITVLFGDSATSPAGIGALASRSTAIGGSALLQAAREALELSQRASPGEAVEAEAVYHNEGEAWGNGCYVATASVDRETGTVSVERLFCVDDAGTIVNPLLLEGQVMGGIAQGLGEAMMERIVYDEDGQLLTGSLMDYALPRADDMPEIGLRSLETPSPFNLLGAKGVGEAGTIGAPPAILNAVLDALSPLGVENLAMPLTSERVWRAMRAAEEKNR